MTTRPAIDIIETDERNGETDRLNVETSYTAAALKKLMGFRIIVCKDDNGQLWATNSYFVTPARRFVPMFEQYISDDDRGLLDPTAHDDVANGASLLGVWDLTGKHPTLGTADPPNMTMFTGVKPTEGEVVRRLRIAATQNRAYTLGIDDVLLAVFEFADGRTVAFNNDFLTLILAGAAKTSYGERVKCVQIRCIDHLKPAHVWAQMEAKRGGHTDPNKPGHYIKESWVKDEPRLLGVLMPVRMG